MIKSPILNPKPVKGWVSRDFQLGTANYDLNAIYSPDTAYDQTIVLDLVSPKFEPNKTYIFDKSRFGYHGTITGATWVRLPSGLWSLSFDGTDDYIVNNTADFRIGDSQGAIELWFKTSTSAYQVLFSSDDTATTTSKVLLQVTAVADGNTGNVRIIQQNANDEADVVRGGTAVIDGKWRHVVLNSSGTAYSILLNGVAESLTVQGGANTGDWFADTTLRDNFGFGIENHTGLVLDYTGQLALMRIYSQPLSVATALQHYESERHLLGV